jgi:hypothetical protein
MVSLALAGVEVRGEVLYLHTITRSEMGAYMCVAKNGVPPAVSKIVQLNVNCKFLQYTCDRLWFLNNKTIIFLSHLYHLLACVLTH